ncbi:AI-2E family transporter [Fulvivirga sp. RKSG066]|uniref:AI-2E family transporter n=1 Tax=Fulvivirga aurantia TaxID=2529383 RepID=UPI0012BC076B|nr:AI-2E family transporter [Fulvivirga aurantia]MTI21388.1 AI-2E family transporter [Fulvivirga aurantia]
MNNLTSSKVIKVSLVSLAVIAIGFVIVIGRDFIYPVCLAVLFAYLVYPLTSFLEKYIKYKVLATLISVIITVTIVAGAIFFLYTQLTEFLGDFTGLKSQANENFGVLKERLQEKLPFVFDERTNINGLLQGVLGAQENLLRKVFNATTGTLVGLGLQPVYVYFMLYYRNHFKEFLFEVTKPSYHDRLKITLEQIASVTKNYVSGVFIVVLILCVLNSVGLTIIGVKYALMFGVISAIMNFIPYFGTLIGGAIPLLYTLVSPHPEKAIGVIILFLIIQFTENNILTPNITGGRVAINPLFTIFIIIIGGLAWGLPGMFIFVPFLGMFKVVCEHIDSLKPLAKVISPKNPEQLSPGLDWIKKQFSNKK